VKRTVIAVVILLMAAGAAAVAAQGGVRVLVIDETKTFASTMRVAALVGGLKAAGPFEVSYRVADVGSIWDDPLAGIPPSDDPPYDLIVVVSRGIDDGTSDWVWILSNGLSSLPPPVCSGIGMIGILVDRVFGGEVRTLKVYDDFILPFLSALYVNEGWLR